MFEFCLTNETRGNRYYLPLKIINVSHSLVKIRFLRMGRVEKIFDIVIGGKSDNNIRFEEVRNLLKSLGFDERLKGSHHIFYMDGIEEIINLQPKFGKSKPYQVKQIRNILLKYKLEINKR